MLLTLFVVTIVYEIIKSIMMFNVYCNDKCNGICLLSELAITAVVIVFAALSISFSGTFAFVLGIIFASMCGLGVIANCIPAAQGHDGNGFFSIYNLVMMTLFIVALSI